MAPEGDTQAELVLPSCNANIVCMITQLCECPKLHRKHCEAALTKLWLFVSLFAYQCSLRQILKLEYQYLSIGPAFGQLVNRSIYDHFSTLTGLFTNLQTTFQI